MWAVDVRMDGDFTISRPRLLSEKSGYPPGVLRDRGISPDCQRSLIVKLDDRKPQPVTEMILVQNWSEELRRLSPTGKK